MGLKEKEFFVRPASGLVREVSTVKASFFNLAGAVGNGPALGTAYIVLFPAMLIFGLPLYSWAITIAAVPFAVAYLLCLAILTHAMPRSGGDYVYTSRITSPLLGWLEGWTLIWAAAGAIGYNGWATVYNLGALFKAALVLSPSWFGVGVWINQTYPMLGLGWVMLLFVVLLAIAPTRTFHTILTALSLVAAVSVLVQLVPMIGMTSQTFAANFLKYTGMTQQQVITLATQQGWNPTWFNWTGVWALLGFSMFSYNGFTFSTYLAGELKGNIQRNVALSTFFGLAVPTIISAYYILPYFSIAGYDFVNAWAYLFWNAPNLAPMQAPPLTTILVALGRPDAAALTIIAGFPLMVLFNFVCVVVWISAPVRVIFAQTMDRLYPKKLAEVNARTHQPLYATALMVIIGYVFYSSAIIGYSPAGTLWYAVVLAFLTYLCPALNCLLIGRRRPDLFAMTPAWARKRVLGLSVMTWLVMIWLIFMIPVFAVTNFWGIISGFFGLAPQQLLTYIFTSGLNLIVLLLVVGTIWYYVAKYYNRRRGIEIEMVFKAIPPE